MPRAEICAIAGAVGGAGTTRFALEAAGTLARAGRDVCVVDAAYATQGLATALPGRLDPDLTRLVTDDDPALDAVLVDHPAAAELPGRLSCAPVRAPFERIASAKTAAAARRFEEVLAGAAERADHVLVDVPPVAANQAVAAVTTADRVAGVVPATARGRDALPRLHDRLADLGTGVDVTVATRGADEHPVAGADATVPTAPETALHAAPTCVDPDSSFAPAVAAATETALDTDLDLSFPDGSVLGRVVGRQ